MRWLNQLVMQVRMLLFRRTADAQLNEELRFHMQQQIAENRAAGMSDEEARLAALRTFGNPDLVREKTGATWNWNGLDQFLRDFRIGARTLSRTPGFAVVAILITALSVEAVAFPRLRPVADSLRAQYPCCRRRRFPSQPGRRRRLRYVEQRKHQFQQSGSRPRRQCRPLGVGRSTAGNTEWSTCLMESVPHTRSESSSRSRLHIGRR